MNEDTSMKPMRMREREIETEREREISNKTESTTRNVCLEQIQSRENTGVTL